MRYSCLHTFLLSFLHSLHFLLWSVFFTCFLSFFGIRIWCYQKRISLSLLTSFISGSMVMYMCAALKWAINRVHSLLWWLWADLPPQWPHNCDPNLENLTYCAKIEIWVIFAEQKFWIALSLLSGMVANTAFALPLETKPEWYRAKNCTVLAAYMAALTLQSLKWTELCRFLI